tara:strand:- start:230 stop:580 length:351 start_codon:yes stop_codon:yes gene_type:complete
MKPHKKNWKDLTFDEKVVVSELYQKGDKWANHDPRRSKARRAHRETVITLLEMRGWIDIYDALRMLGMPSTSDNAAKLRRKAKYRGYKGYRPKTSRITFWKKSDILELKKLSGGEA